MSQIRDHYHQELLDMVDELIYQKSIDDYKATQRAAYIGVLVNRTMGGKMELKDLIGEPPRRDREIEDGLRKARDAAKAKGVSVPDERR